MAVDAANPLLDEASARTIAFEDDAVQVPAAVIAHGFDLETPRVQSLTNRARGVYESLVSPRRFKDRPGSDSFCIYSANTTEPCSFWSGRGIWPVPAG